MPLPLYDETMRLHSPTVRRASVGLTMAAALVVMAPAVGEPDRRESRAISLLRGIQTEETLHFTNHGYYDTLQCLASTDCIGNQGSRDVYQGLLSADVAALRDYQGYRLLFYPGPRSSVPGTTAGATPLTDYAMVLVPQDAVKPTLHAYCADRTGRIYRAPGTRIPRVQNGRCLETSDPLQ